jgi:hypothetical protein
MKRQVSLLTGFINGSARAGSKPLFSKISVIHADHAGERSKQAAFAISAVRILNAIWSVRTLKLSRYQMQKVKRITPEGNVLKTKEFLLTADINYGMDKKKTHTFV